MQHQDDSAFQLERSVYTSKVDTGYHAAFADLDVPDARGQQEKAQQNKKGPDGFGRVGRVRTGRVLDGVRSGLGRGSDAGGAPTRTPPQKKGPVDIKRSSSALAHFSPSSREHPQGQTWGRFCASSAACAAFWTHVDKLSHPRHQHLTKGLPTRRPPTPLAGPRHTLPRALNPA